MLSRLAAARSLLLDHELLDKGDHLLLIHQAISICVYFNENLFELGLIVVVWRWAILQDSLQEVPCFFLVKLAAMVIIEIFPDFLDGVCVDTILLIFWRDLPGESAITFEDLVVNKHLNVAREALPNDRSFVVEGFTVDHNHLLQAFRLGCLSVLSILFKLQLRLHLLRLRYVDA